MFNHASIQVQQLPTHPTPHHHDHHLNGIEIKSTSLEHALICTLNLESLPIKMGGPINSGREIDLPQIKL